MVKYNNSSLNGVFGALSGPTRRRIVELLAQGPVNVSEIASNFEISLPAVSKHLRILEDAGIIKREIRGREHRLSLHANPMEDAFQWLSQYRRFWEDSLQSLSDHLGENPKPKED